MSATTLEVITSTREVLQDTVAPYRYSDARLIGTFNNALRETLRLRPDLFLSNSFVVTPLVEADATTSTTFPIEDQYFSTIVNFIVGFTELSDDEFTVDGRAITVLASFKSQLVGKLQ